MVSNKKFGYSFSIIFFSIYIILIYFDINGSNYALTISILFLILSMFKPNYLSKLNNYWFKLSLFLSRVLNPIILAIIFFLIFSPISILMRIFGRDELKIKNKSKITYWINCKETYDKNYFWNQF